MLKVAFYKGTRPGIAGIYNRGVRLVEKGPYSHCEVIFSDGVAASSSFMDGGVRFKEITFDTNKWDFVEVATENEQAVRDWYILHQGTPYDLKGNIHFILGFVGDNKSKYFCSESIAASLGIPDAWRYGPNALYSLLKYLTKPLN